MELKLHFSYRVVDTKLRSNRTFMELKFGSRSGGNKGA